MSVDVADVVGGDAGIFQGGVGDAIAAVAAFGGLSDVVGVTGHTVADNFGENIRAAFLGDFEGFENHDAGAFADDEAVAVGVEGAAGVFRVIVAGGERAHGGESADAHGGDGGFGAAGDHDVGGAALDNFEGVADGVGRRGAGGGRGGIGTLGAVTNRDVAGSEIDDGGRNEKRGNLSGAAGEIFGMFALDDVETADAGADVNAGGIGEFGRDGERGLLHGEIGGGERQLNEAAGLFQFFFLEPIERLEALYFAGDAAIETSGIEMSDGTDAAFGGENVAPDFFGPDAETADESDAGNDHAAIQRFILHLGIRWLEEFRDSGLRDTGLVLSGWRPSRRLEVFRHGVGHCVS